LLVGLGAAGCGEGSGSVPDGDVISVTFDLASPGGEPAVQFFAEPNDAIKLGLFEAYKPGATTRAVSKDFGQEAFGPGDRIPLQPDVIWWERTPGDWKFTFTGERAN